MLPKESEHLTENNNITHQMNEASVIGKDLDPLPIYCLYIRYAKVVCAGKETRKEVNKYQRNNDQVTNLASETILCEKNWTILLGKTVETYPCYSLSNTFSVICPHS